METALREAGNLARKKERKRREIEKEGKGERRERERKTKRRKCGEEEQTEGIKQRKAISTAIVRKPCKDCGPISAPSCVREFISSALLPFVRPPLFLISQFFTVASVQRLFLSEREE